MRAALARRTARCGRGGRNDRGQLGDGTTQQRPFPVTVAGFSGVFSGVSSIAAGTNHGVAVRQDGTVWAWVPTTWGSWATGP
jgi:alpha-tubulin suppressor-like RCC1 family protein